MYVHLGALICRLSHFVICILLNILYFLSIFDATVWSEDIDNIVFRLYVDGFPYRKCVGNVINCFFLAGGSQCFKRNFAEISVEFQVLDIFLKFRLHDRSGWIFIFQAG